MVKVSYILLIASIFILPPYIRYIIKRIIFYIKLKTICWKKGYSVYLRSAFSLFAGIRGKHSDLYIRTPLAIFSVKFGGSLSMSMYYHFIDETRYSIKDMRFAFAPGAGRDIQYQEKSKPEYDFYSGLADSHAAMDIVPIFIMLPYPKDVTFGPFRETLSNGNDIGECYFYSGSGFLSRLKQL